MKALADIQKVLKAESSKEAKAFFKKAVPSPLHIYGVRAPIINQLVKQYKKEGFPLVEALWLAGSMEEKIMAGKLLGAICKTDPEYTLQLLQIFTPQIEDWAVCDGLGVGGIRGISKVKRQEIWDIAKKYQRSAHVWTRRMGIILMLHYAKDPEYRQVIERQLSLFDDDKEHYIKKAVTWLNRVLKSNRG